MDPAHELTAVMAAIHARGWCDGTGGNFSRVRQREPLQLLMAPSGVDKGNVSPADLILVDRKGQVIEGEGRASAETPLHLEIIRRSEAGAVLHTHSPAATLLSRWALSAPAGSVGVIRSPQVALVFSGLEMLKGLEGVTTHEDRILLPVLENDQDLKRLSAHASDVIPAAPHGLLIGGHGLYAWGSDLFQARRHLEVLEFLLDQRWRELQLMALEVVRNGE
jgi:methylthioribulose-1-phosphate dehydratase